METFRDKAKFLETGRELEGGQAAEGMVLDHDAPAKQYDAAGLNAAQIVATAQDALGIERPGIVALSS